MAKKAASKTEKTIQVLRKIRGVAAQLTSDHECIDDSEEILNEFSLLADEAVPALDQAIKALEDGEA